MRPSAACGGDDFIGRGVGPAVGDVFADRAVEQGGVLGHHGDGPTQGLLGHPRDVLAVDQDAPLLDVVEPLDQLDEGGLARACRSHQRHPLARRDQQREVPVQGLRLAPIGEGHVLEGDLAEIGRERPRVERIGHVGGPPGIGRHVLAVVQPLLHHAHVLADIAQISAHLQEGGDPEGHVARRRLPAAPQPHQDAGQAGLQHHQHQVLDDPDIDEARPGDQGGRPPLGQQQGEARLLPPLGPEALDRGIGGDGVGQRPADPRVQGIGSQIGRPHVKAGEAEVQGDVDGDDQHGENADQGPAEQHHDAEAGQNHRRLPERQDDGVRGPVIAPHGAADPPHSGAREIVGVPVGRERLHPQEGVVGHVLHVARRQRVPEPEGDVAEHGEAQEDAHEQAPGRPGAPDAEARTRHGVDQLLGGQRHAQLAGQRHQGEQDGGRKQPAPAHPMRGDEGQYLAVGQDAFARAVLGVVRDVGHGRPSHTPEGRGEGGHGEAFQPGWRQSNRLCLSRHAGGR